MICTAFFQKVKLCKTVTELNGVVLFITDVLVSFVDRQSRGQEAGSRPLLPGHCRVAAVGQPSRTHCSFVVYEMTVGPAIPAL